MARTFFGFRRIKRGGSDRVDIILLPASIRRTSRSPKKRKTNWEGVPYQDIERAMEAIPTRANGIQQVEYRQVAPIWPDQWQQLCWHHRLAGMSSSEIAKLYPMNAKTPADVAEALRREGEVVAAEQASTKYKVVNIARCENIISELWDRRSSPRIADTIERFMRLQLHLSGEVQAPGTTKNEVTVGVVATGGSVVAGAGLPASSYAAFGAGDLKDAAEIIEAEFTDA